MTVGKEAVKMASRLGRRSNTLRAVALGSDKSGSGDWLVPKCVRNMAVGGWCTMSRIYDCLVKD
jgi:hypothetical protein